MDQVEQLLSQFPGPIRLLQRRSRTRLLDCIMWDVAFLSIVLAEPGWLSRLLPAWSIADVTLGIIGMVLLVTLLAWLVPWLADPWLVWFFPAVFIVLSGLHLQPSRFLYYLSIIALIFKSSVGLYEIVALSDPGRLILDENGFEIKEPLRKTYRVQWANSSNFEVRKKTRISISDVFYDNADRGHSWFGRRRILNSGWNSVLAGTYRLTPESLALLMTQWRERALEQQSLAGRR